MSRWRRISQLATELGSQLQQTRGVKASTKKLPVVLLKNVDGLGTAGKLLNVNHGYARNYLIPKRLVDYVVSSKRSSRPDRKLQQGDFRQKSDGSADQAAKKESVQHRKQLELLFNKLTSTQLVVKRKTLPDSKALAQEVAVKDIVGKYTLQAGPALSTLGGSKNRKASSHFNHCLHQTNQSQLGDVPEAWRVLAFQISC